MRNSPRLVPFISALAIIFLGAVSAEPVFSSGELSPPVFSNTGILTSFKYSVGEWIDTFEPLTGATNITIPIGTGGDGWFREIELPFEFDYYGTVYPEFSTLTLTDDMYISFNPYVGGSDSWLNDCLDDTEPNNMIAPFWDDGISYSSNAQLLYKIEGTSPDRLLIVEWRDFDVLSPAYPSLFIISIQVSHQVLIFENGDIEFRYGARQSPYPANIDCREQQKGCSATIGIEGIIGGVHERALVYCESADIMEGLVIHFFHPFVSDLDDDDDVDGVDLSLFSDYYKSLDPRADLNGDAVIDGDDVSKFADEFGLNHD